MSENDDLIPSGTLGGYGSIADAEEAQMLDASPLRSPVFSDSVEDIVLEHEEISPGLTSIQRSPDGLDEELTDNDDLSAYYKLKSKKSFESYILILWKEKWMLLLAFAIIITLLLLDIFSDDWRSLKWQAWMSMLITVVTLVALVGNYYPPAYIFLFSMSLCYGLEIIDSADAFEGFSNTGVITVGVMFIVAKAIELSGVLKYLVRYVLRQPKTLFVAQIRLLIPVLLLSAFINNTPIVAMMIPVVENWGAQNRLPVAKLMMPLSYAAILGGTCTIIGTSTNLIVEGLAQSSYPNYEVGFFEVGIIGFPVALVSLVYIFIFSRWLLPSSTETSTDVLMDSIDDSGAPNQRKMYSSTLRVTKGAQMIGKTVNEAGLTKLAGLRLFQVLGKLETVDPTKTVDYNATVDPDRVIQAGDVLFFYGMLRYMYVLYQVDGLVPDTTEIAKIEGKRHNRTIVEVVLSPYAPLVGRTVKESHFRSKYNAVILAVHRRGSPIAQQIGQIVLSSGDSLLLEATEDFLKYHMGDPDFLLVHKLRSGESTTPRRISVRMIIVILLAVIMVTLSVFQIYDILPGALLVVCLYVLFGCITWRQSMDSVQGDTLLVIATAFGLGNALQSSGAATVISNTLLNVFGVAGDIGVLFGLYFATALLSAVISNAATATLMFPIAQNFLAQTDLTLNSLVFTLMMAGSSCFATPVGYQTNLMVMAPGGYNTVDYIKFGVPLTLVSMVISVVLIYYVFVVGGLGGDYWTNY